jgi:succinate-semialdehyde dehydrogenase/glutarate-semialdehyde dehydrogenase
MNDEFALYIDGSWCQSGRRETGKVINPATQELIGRLPYAEVSDLDRALSAAERGFTQWRTVSPWERGKILKRAAALVGERLDNLARTLTQEQGKPLAESRGELQRVVETFEWCGEECTRTYGRLLPQRAPGFRQMVIKQPVGPVAAFVPWNFPAILSVRKIAAALAAGCSIIVKPAEETPGVCIGIARACADAGVPAGVLNVVFGVPSEISEHLIKSSIIRKISLTGSIPVGRQLSKLAGEHLKKTTMELGGHAPVIVFDDVDPEKVATMTAAFKFRNAGQVCLAPSRIYVHEAIYDPFLAKFVEFAKHLRVGNGLDAGVEMGPLANARRLSAVEELVADAQTRGARIAAGGKRLGGQGFFWEPTVLTDVPEDSLVMTKEPFGPVAPILPFASFEEVMDRANRLPYGLAAYAFTGSIEKATATADALEAGWIGINNFTPFLAEAPGGGVKESGIGYEGGPEGLDGYMQIKFVSQATL